ncbi:MAG: TonB-dependent receptor plug domain-containing protein [Microscillaceae bacterium]|jgi:iron complex outermembrane receptor protein|nr:TonB-dependent receptor plug domain-containing protein [Microscillaceae bacterium]
MMPPKLLISILLLLGISSQLAKAQDDSLSRDMLQLKVEDMYSQFNNSLLNQQVTIASKKIENLFDAPFSASVLTREDIRRAGCTSIVEAFRLIPGLMVAEQSNGNYDMHLRGGSNVIRNTLFSVSANTSTLVMIDNRPIYNYYLGGTFWETIPIDLNDVERIELVRGPTSAMYGPNAVSGVVNIVTRQVEDQGVYAVANVQQGINQTFINNASLGYRLNKKWNVIASGNFQQRHRTQTSYYNYQRNEYVELSQFPQAVLDDIGNAYPNPERAMQKYGANAFVNFQPNAGTKFSLAMGYQDSEVQKAYSENNASPLTTALSRSHYIDLRGNIRKFTAQFSYQAGTQEEGVGNLGQKWDFITTDGVLEYDINFKNISIKPGLNFRQAIYDDTPYVDVALKTGQFNGRRQITTFAPYLRGDYSLLEDKLRLITALRLDIFNFPDQPYLSYQLAANYKLGLNNLLRLSYSRANGSANIIYTYADRYLPNFRGLPFDLEVSGNQNLKLVTTDLWELGYRSRMSNNLQLEVETWYAQTQNFANFLLGDAFTRVVGGINRTIVPFQTLNIPLKTQQIGITLAMSYATKNFQLRPYLTYQNTTLFNSSESNTVADLQKGIGTKTQHTGTPTWFGGFILNYQAKPFNFNLNPYFFSEYQFFSLQNPTYADGRGRGTIPAKLLINAKISYNPMSSMALFVNIRNALNNQSIEFYNTDPVSLMFLGGLNFDF